MNRRQLEQPEGAAPMRRDGVEYPVSRDELIAVAEERAASPDEINLFKSLPRESYDSEEQIQRDLAEAARRFAMGNNSDNADEDGALRDRRNIGRDMVEDAPEGMTRHP